MCVQTRAAAWPRELPTSGLWGSPAGVGGPPWPAGPGRTTLPDFSSNSVWFVELATHRQPRPTCPQLTGPPILCGEAKQREKLRGGVMATGLHSLSGQLLKRFMSLLLYVGGFYRD